MHKNVKYIKEGRPQESGVFLVTVEQFNCVTS